ncbi:MAG: SDR family oxidoreductase [Candidatus Woesearchaeota archaeon]
MKKVIITGGSSGLGYSLSKLFLENDIKVVNLSRTKPNLKGIIHIKTDLSKELSLKNSIRILKLKHSDADVLILNSGLAHWAESGKIKESEIDNDFSVNIISHIKLTNSLTRIIEKNSGDIIFIGSTASFQGGFDSSVYASTKHAVLGFIRSLQLQMKQKKVRVLGVHPGGFQSNFHIKAKTNLKQEDLMPANEIANLIFSFLKLPKSMEISEIIINRKKLVN